MELRRMIEQIVESDEKMKEAAEIGIRTMVSLIREYLVDEKYDADRPRTNQVRLDYPVHTPRVVLRYIRLKMWLNWRIKVDIISPSPRDIPPIWRLLVEIYDDLYDDDNNDIF